MKIERRNPEFLNKQFSQADLMQSLTGHKSRLERLDRLNNWLPGQREACIAAIEDIENALNVR